MKSYLLVTLGMRALLCLYVSGIAQGYSVPPPPLDATAVSVLHSAQRAETFILLNDLPVSRKDGIYIQDGPELPIKDGDVDAQAHYIATHKLADHFIIAYGRRGDKLFTQASARAILDGRAYDRRLLRRCFNPIYMFRLWDNKKSVLVLLDFHCRQMEIVVRDKHDKTMSKISQTAMGPEFAVLIHLARKAFPHDIRLKAYLPDA